MENAFSRLRCQHLISVSFLQHYLQLHFEEAVLNVYTPITLHSSGVAVRSDGEGFRDTLCRQIAEVVRNAVVHTKEALVIDFEDGSKLSISLRLEDYWAPEAIEARFLAEDMIAF